MTYPPSPRVVNDPAVALRLMAAHPFAHLFSAGGGLHATRIPFLTDAAEGRPTRLRAHLNSQNPQARGLDGAPVLVAFSGPATYVSPHWRVVSERGGTYDYQEVIVRGTARTVSGLDTFRRMIDDLSALIEPQYAEAGDYPVWQTSMAAPGYVEKLVEHVTQFVVEIEQVEIISKLHQHFPKADRESIAEHLLRCKRDDSRAIAEEMRRVP